MKKYIYGTILIAVAAACVIFFLKTPKITNRAGSTALEITFRFPEGYELTEGAPFVLTWRTEGPGGELSAPVTDKNFNPLVSPYKLAFTPAPGSKAVVMNARLYYCSKASRMCFQGDFQTRVPLEPGSSSVPWVWEITPKTGNG